MPELVQQVITFTCDGPGCKNTVTFLGTEEEANKARINNPWMSTIRGVNTTDKRNFLYCSDLCMVNAAQTGIFNPLQPKTIIEAPNAAAIQAAAMAAVQTRKAGQDLKDGKPVNLPVVRA